ncbi:tetratricopeptide repeat protein [Candidatus Manganitrophus noduliformans]|uniref:Tetratricopeptide repeat protein n=1 Tax=Candidatus Manganitrophus noduliformans TaxID=2606439 RepID=A0A7X6IAJ1_9BACT|nr:tetratricopeptide repeat protein [Candidatus Manganitrophus noduliformans]NKE70598.1 tetratricopeptide repeat protein [Candidatus Manganitrophus noduliformans]
MLGEIVISYCATNIGDAILKAVRDRYNPIVTSAAKTTAEQLKQKYGNGFEDIWGSQNFIEMLPSLGSTELDTAIESTYQGKWDIEEARVAQAISNKLSENMPQLKTYALEFVQCFLSNLTHLLKEKDHNALTKRLFVRQEEIGIMVQETHKSTRKILEMFPIFQASLQKIDSFISDIDLKDKLTLSERKRCEEVLKRCDLLISRYQFNEAREAAFEIKEVVHRIAELKVLGRFYNTLAQIESYGGNKSSPEALDYLNRAAEYLPDNAVIKTNIGVHYYAAGEINRAREILSSFSPDKKGASNYYNLEGLICVSEKNLTGAETSFRRAIENDETHWEARFNLGRTLAELEKLLEAETVFSNLHEAHPQFLPAYTGLCNVFFELSTREVYGSEQEKRYLETARKWISDCLQVLKVLKIDERYIINDIGNILGNLGAVEAALGNISEAQRHLLRSISLVPSRQDPHYNLALIYHKLEQFDKATSELEEAVKLGRNDEMTETNLAAMYLAMFNQSRNIEYLQKALNLSKELVDKNGCSLALNNLCMVYFMMKEEYKVKEVCENVLAKNPTCLQALSELALYYDRTDNAAEAITIRARILEFDPDDFDTNYALGSKHYEAQEWDKAIPLLIKCIKPSPLSSNLLPNIYIMLARCHKAMEDDIKPFDVLQAGLKRYPENIELKKEVSRLAEVSPERSPRLFVPKKPS